MEDRREATVEKTNTLGLITTAYNSADFCDLYAEWLLDNIESFEKVMIVDDCSKDDTYDLLKSRLGEHPKITVARTEANTGRPATPRNMGIDAFQTSGLSHVIFHDIDDGLSKSYLEILKGASSDEIVSGVKFRTAIPYTREFMDFCSKRIYLPLWLVKYKNFITTSGACVPTAMIGETRFFTKPLEDWIFWCDLDRKTPGRKVLVVFGFSVSYYSEITLSPKKNTQLKRVHKRSGFLGFIPYSIGAAIVLATEKLNAFHIKSRSQKAD